jgi:hypothetical protein
MSVLIRSVSSKTYPPKMIAAKSYSTLARAQAACARLSERARPQAREYWVAIGPDGRFYPMARHVWNTGEPAESFSLLPQPWA